VSSCKGASLRTSTLRRFELVRIFGRCVVAAFARPGLFVIVYESSVDIVVMGWLGKEHSQGQNRGAT
jgi:hypothetical protein